MSRAKQFFKKIPWKLRMGNFLGAPIYIHASILLCLLYFWARYGFVEGLISTLCFVILMLVHEMGHAWFVRRYQHELIDIQIYPIHGVCNFKHDIRRRPETLIFAGGLIAQLILLAFWLLILSTAGILTNYDFLEKLVPATRVLVGINLLTIFLNALPIRGLDGRELWSRLFRWLSAKRSPLINKLPATLRPKKYRPADKIVDIALQRARKK